jgi:toxin-antitoxin system PIN domain toxin
VIALDTNLLVHAHRRDASLHVPARNAVRQLAESGRPWGICFHSLVEFYGVVTQPRLWSVASTPEQAMEQITAWRESHTLSLLTDSAATLSILQSLLVQAKVQGALVHDARIAACCLENGVSELWSVDRDFSRFPQLTTRNPLV